MHQNLHSKMAKMIINPHHMRFDFSDKWPFFSTEVNKIKRLLDFLTEVCETGPFHVFPSG